MFKEKIEKAFGEDCGFVDELNDMLVRSGLNDFIVADHCNTKITEGLGIAGFYDEEEQILYFINSAISPHYHGRTLFLLLHELGHHQRNKKGRLTSLEDYLNDETVSDEEIVDYMVNEEKIADRYASINYYRLTGELLPENQFFSRRMENGMNIERVREMIDQFKTMDGDEYKQFKQQVVGAFLEEETENV